jgi:D-glycero-D-manno-heptose 1,7-bisphosphate phosphatase
MKRAVFLDRDGVLNNPQVIDGKPYPPKDAASMAIADGAKEALMQLKSLGFLLICATNQPDFARGKRTFENINLMNEKIMRALPLDDLFCCLHDNLDKCDCRKPRPGMLISASKKWGIDLSASFMIGDRDGDIAAGKAAGTKTIFIDCAYDEPINQEPDFICKNLKDAADFIKRNLK